MDYGSWLPARVARVGGPAAVPGLRRLLTDGRDEEVREAAAQTLGLLGSVARPAISDLARAAQHGNDEALSALIELDAEAALDIASRNAETSGVAAFALVRRLGDRGLAEVGRKLRGNRDVSELMMALRDRGDAVEKLASDMLFAVRNRSSLVERLQIADLMLTVGPPKCRQPVRDAVKDLSRRKDEWVRRGAERILAMAGDPKAMRSWVGRIGRHDQLGFINYDSYRTVCTMGSRAAPALARLIGVFSRTGHGRLGGTVARHRSHRMHRNSRDRSCPDRGLAESELSRRAHGDERPRANCGPRGRLRAPRGRQPALASCGKGCCYARAGRRGRSPIASARGAAGSH